MSKKYYFISDIHLGLQSKEKEDQKEKVLVSFLRSLLNQDCELFILGDLFDYWFEYRRVYQKGFYRTLSALKDLTEAGIAVHYFIGNHDFMHRDFFTKEIGVNLYEDPKIFQLETKKFFLGHGDGMVSNDTGYNILKMILRNKFIQWLYSLVHPDIGISIASRTSKESRQYTDKKDYGETDGLYESAKKKIDEGFDYVILGHLHAKIFNNYKNGYYINLGTWLKEPCFGVFSNNKFEIFPAKAD